MSRASSFLDLRAYFEFSKFKPGDVLYAKDDIPRQIGSINWYGGKFCEAGQHFIVTDVYPFAIRVVHSEGGIHFFCSRRNLRSIRFLKHGKPPTDQVARRGFTDKDYGSWPNYKGIYRKVQIVKPPTFAFNAKRKTVGKDRRKPKTKPKTK